MNKLTIIATLILYSAFFTTNAQTVVSNIRIQQSDEQLIIMYDLRENIDIELYVSFDGGLTFQGPLQHVVGSVGKNVARGNDKVVVWNVLREFGPVDIPSAVIKILTQDDVLPLQPSVLLRTHGRSVYHDNRNLTQREVRNIMANTEALRQYNRGVRQNRAGNICVWAGIGLIGFGSMFVVMGNEIGTYDPVHGNEPIEPNELLILMGAAYLVYGVGSFVTGVVLKSTSKKHFSNAVNTYNRGGSRADVELKFGIIGNGVGLAITF